ncbi:putative disease resistance RPP13-like protein 1 [Curcuma longa]|uniref:putative disease resistance RPP13-like protein 1 n=1 Tax=Curcuma longa TaxID=136217 RepID=UPI003D9DD6A7
MATDFGASIRSLFERFLTWPLSSDPPPSVQADLEKLKTILHRIHAVLYDAERREIQYKTDQLRLKELKDLAHDAEDVIDDYNYHTLRSLAEDKASHKRKRDEEVLVDLSNSSPNGNVEKLAEIAGQIRKIFDKFTEILKSSVQFSFTRHDGEHLIEGSRHPPVTSSMVNESCILGREKEKKELINFFLSENREENVSAICIFGIAGKGKTTLAQIAYNNDRVCKHFDRKGWVWVPRHFDITKLTKSVLEAVTVKACGLTELNTLQHALKNELWQKKVLLVLDNVWDVSSSNWESFLMPFVDAEKVRIVITTRNKEVTKNTQSQPYPFDELPAAECWSLFTQYAFGGQNSSEANLCEIGKKIVQKCDCLPLAIKALACLLRNKTEAKYWDEVLTSEIWELENENEILPALMLSYKYLPIHLKPLFLFCSMFPKGYLFEKEELVRLWMAHNYIQPRGCKRVEDVGQECFNELKERSFFDVVAKTTKYKMHGMIHSLGQSIAKKEFQAVLSKHHADISDEVRHLYVKGKGEIVDSLHFHKPNALRTLLYECLDAVVPRIPRVSKLRCLQHVFTDSSHESVCSYLACLIHLRYLRVYNKEFERFPESIRVYNKEFERFPESICQLYNLQSLILDYCGDLEELPGGIGNLVNLRYIGLSSLNITRLPDSICQLSNLQKLKLNDCRNIKELPSGINNLFHLRELVLCQMDISELPDSVCQLTNLQVLELSGCCNLSRLPRDIGNLSNLYTLEVTDTEIQELPESICRLSKLQKLSLSGNWNLEDLPSNFGELASLRYLELNDVGIRTQPKCLSDLSLQYLRYKAAY